MKLISCMASAFLVTTFIAGCGGGGGGGAASSPSKTPSFYDANIIGIYSDSQGFAKGNLGGNPIQLSNGTMLDNVTVFDGGQGGKGYIAKAGFSGGTFDAPPTSGTITFDTNFRLSGQKNLRGTQRGGDVIKVSGSPINQSGQAKVTANFDTGKITSNLDYYFNLNGTIDGNDIEGIVKSGGHRAIMAGKLDDDNLAGAFHYSGGNTAFSGIFYGSPKP